VQFLLSGIRNTDGTSLASGKVYTYDAGTLNYRAVYSDVGGTIPLSQPFQLDANGMKQVYADGSYKFIIRTSAEADVYEFDNLFFGTTLDLGAREATDAGNATARTSLITYGQVQDGVPPFVSTVGGTANAISLSPAVAITSYTTGSRFSFVATTANTSTVTVAISGLSAKDIRKGTSLTPLSAGDIIAGAIYEITYNGTYFILTKGPGLNVHNRTATDISISNSAAETTIYTTTIPGGTLGAYRGLRLTMFGIHDNDTGSDRTFTWAVKLGATTLCSTFNTISTDPGNDWFFECVILSNNSTTAQKASMIATMVDTKATIAGESVVDYGTGAENTANDLTLVVTMTLSTASSNLTFGLKGAILEYL